MLKILVLIPSLLFFTSCLQPEGDLAEKPDRTITIEIIDSDVVKLDGNEIHISFLEDQVALLAEKVDLSVQLHIEPNAMAGVVYDVQQATKQLYPKVYADR